MGVVLVHTSMFALGNQRHLDSWAWWTADVGNSLGRSASTIFAMVAGAVLLARPIEVAPCRFIWQRISRLFVALAGWTAIYLLWRHWQGEILTFAVVARDIVAGRPFYHLWFLYAMLGAYVLMPGMRLLVREPVAKVAWLSTLATAAFAGAYSTDIVATGIWPGMFIGLTPLLVPYVLAGGLLYRDGVPLSTPTLAMVAALAVLAIMLLVAWLHPAATPQAARLMHGLRVPLTYLWIGGLFLLVLRMPRDPGSHAWARRIAPVTLGIYAVHPLWIDLFERAGFGIKQPGGSWLLYAVLIYALSAVTALALGAIPGLRRLAR